MKRSKDSIIGGVCGGIAEYFDVDPLFVRLGVISLSCFGFAITIFLYFVFWVIMDEK